MVAAAVAAVVVVVLLLPSLLRLTPEAFGVGVRGEASAARDEGPAHGTVLVVLPDALLEAHGAEPVQALHDGPRLADGLQTYRATELGPDELDRAPHHPWALISLCVLLFVIICTSRRRENPPGPSVEIVQGQSVVPGRLEPLGRLVNRFVVVL